MQDVCYIGVFRIREVTQLLHFSEDMTILKRDEAPEGLDYRNQEAVHDFVNDYLEEHDLEAEAEGLFVFRVRPRTG